MNEEQKFEIKVLGTGLASLVIAVVAKNYQQAMTADGDFLLPRIARHHLSNLFDGAAFTGIASSLIRSALRTSWDAAGKIGAATTIAAGMGHEFHQAALPNRTFDWVDCALYVPSAVILSHYISTQSKKLG